MTLYLCMFNIESCIWKVLESLTTMTANCTLVIGQFDSIIRSLKHIKFFELKVMLLLDCKNPP